MICVSKKKKTSKTCYQEGERYDEKNEKKGKYKNDKFPRARDWTLTTDRNMVRSDALPTELRGTCRYVRLNFKVMFGCPLHCKNQA